MRRPFLLGLTGSIGMGKSTTAQMFADAGVPVWDADASVHQLYAPGGAAVRPIGKVFPQAITKGGVDRRALKSILAGDAQALSQLEAIVHPLTFEARTDFIAAHQEADLILLDIPLLFETRADAECDASVVVSAPPEVQRARVLERPGMTEARFRLILARQMPDAQKRTRATHLIETHTLEQTHNDVQHLIAQIKEGRDA